MHHIRLLILCMLGGLCLPAILPAQTISIEGSGSDYTFTVEPGSLPPFPEVEGMEEPFYQFFWEFGDGYFARSQTPVFHRYRQSVSGGQPTYTVRVRSHAIYSPDPDPPVETQLLEGVVPHPTAPNNLMDSLEQVSLQTSCFINQVRPDDRFTAVLLYKRAGQPTPGSNGVNGALSLYFHKDFVEPEGTGNIRTHHDESLLQIAEPVTGDPRYTHRVRWGFNGLNDARSLFADMRVKSTLPDGQEPVVYLKLRLEYREGPAPVVQEDEIFLTVGTAKDPNAMSFYPTCIQRSDPPQVLTSRVTFLNEGTGWADDIVINIPVPKGLDPNTVHIVDTRAGRAGSFVVSPSGYYQSEQNALRFVFEEAHLPGLRMPGLLEAAGAEGYVVFEITTDPSLYPPDPSFATQASIVFNAEAPIVTNEARVRLAGPKDPCVGDPKGQDDNGSIIPDDPYVRWSILVLLIILILGLLLRLLRKKQK